jgi:hypothetical protein
MYQLLRDCTRALRVKGTGTTAGEVLGHRRHKGQLIRMTPSRIRAHDLTILGSWHTATVGSQDISRLGFIEHLSDLDGLFGTDGFVGILIDFFQFYVQSRGFVIVWLHARSCATIPYRTPGQTGLPVLVLCSCVAAATNDRLVVVRLIWKDIESSRRVEM